MLSHRLLPRRRAMALGLTALCGAFAAGCAGGDAESPKPRLGSGGEESVDVVIHLAADYPAYGDLASAISASDLVITAEVRGSRTVKEHPVEDPQATATLSPEDREAMAVVMTVTEVNILEVISGEVEPGTTLSIHQLGGVLEEDGHREEYIADGTTPLRTLESLQVLLLLEARDDGGFSPLNPTEGLLIVDGDALTPLPEAPDGYASNATVEDVRELCGS